MLSVASRTVPPVSSTSMIDDNGSRLRRFLATEPPAVADVRAAFKAAFDAARPDLPVVLPQAPGCCARRRRPDGLEARAARASRRSRPGAGRASSSAECS
jgi:hypothetical protein